MLGETSYAILFIDNLSLDYDKSISMHSLILNGPKFSPFNLR